MDIIKNKNGDVSRGVGYGMLLAEEGSLVFLYRGPGQRLKCLCQLMCISLPELNRHLSSCRAATGLGEVVSKIRCANCVNSFDSMAKCAHHFKSCEGGERLTGAALSRSADSDALKLKCTFCPRTFDTTIGLGQHRRHEHARDLHKIAAPTRVPRWNATEDDLLVEAEAQVRIDNKLTDERVIRTFPLNMKICEEISRKFPDFDRTDNSVQQRRAHGGTAHFEKVLARKQEINRQITAQQQSNLKYNLRSNEQDRSAGSDSCNGKDHNPPASLVAKHDTHLASVANTTVGTELTCGSIFTSQESSLAGYDGCLCGKKLLKAITNHLKVLEDVGGEGTEKICNVFNTMIDRLDAYDESNVLTLLKQAAPQAQLRTWDKPGGAPNKKVHGGKSYAEKCAKRAKVRTIFEKQGHKSCLQYLRNPADSGLPTPKTVEMFKSVFESAPSYDEASFVQHKTRTDSHSIHSPVSASEVSDTIRQLKKHAAPGVDGARVEDLLRMNPANLACIYNLFLLHKDVPSGLKQNKTTMIPKSASPGEGDWRPITVSSIIDRLFGKILESRLSRVVKLDPKQRGFIRGLDGCGENITAYGGALRYAKRKAKSLVIVSLDLAKAFDSVQYSTITRALRRLGVDAESTKLVRNLCHGQVTNIKHNAGIERVELKKGVRQGWPLSPVLFLCVIDELLAELKEADGFKIEAGGEVQTLTGTGFADDIILYSSSPHGMKRHINTAVEWCRERSMQINPHKSTLLHLRNEPRGKKVILDTLDIQVEGKPIPVISDEFQRVLGVHMKHSGKVNNEISTFSRDLELVRKSNLRPSQKLSMICQSLIPSIKFRLIYGFANKGACEQIDKITRSNVKAIFHMAKFITNMSLHLTKKQGGWGLPCLSNDVPLAQAALVLRMKDSANPVTRLLVESGVFEKRGYLYGATDNTLANTDLRFVHQQQATVERSKFYKSRQGSGWSSYLSAPRNFIDYPRQSRWKECDVIDVLKMRSNLLVTRELMACTTARGQGIDISCRSCHASTEWQSHILGRCSGTQIDRNRRHDSVCDYIGRRLHRLMKEDCNSPIRIIRVDREKSIILQPGDDASIVEARTLKPDFVVHCPNTIIIMEVSVVYECDIGNASGYIGRRTNSLNLVRNDKARKYEVLRKKLARQEGKRCVFRPLIVGARGGWMPFNNKLFHELSTQLSPFDRNCCVERAIKGSLITYRRFCASTREPLLKHIPTAAGRDER